MRTLGSRDYHVVVVGGGFGGLQAVSKLRRAPVVITLVDRRNFHLFQPLTYQVATGALSPGQPMTMSVDHAEAARGESIAVGLFVDGVPESIALGLTIAEGEIGLALLVGIVVGNVAEAYGAAQPIITGGHAKRFAVLLLGGMHAFAEVSSRVATATVLGFIAGYLLS